MRINNEIYLEDIHTFNNWGTFTVNYAGCKYKAKYDNHGDNPKLEFLDNAPNNLYDIVYNWLFNECE